MERRRWGRRRHDVRYALMMVVALVATYGAWQAHETAQSLAAANLQAIRANEVRIARLVAANRLALLEGCERLNIERARTNVAAYADYVVDKVVLRQTSLRRAGRPFVGPLAIATASKQWTPLTDCAEAVNANGVRYRSPRPVPFSTRLPPSPDLAIP